MSKFTDFRNSLEDKVSEFFTSLKAKILDALEAGVNSLEKAAADNESKVEGDIVDFFKQTASDSVIAASTTGGSNADKAAAALASFTASLATKGIALAENDAKLLLESAYANYKASLPQTPQTAEVAQAEATVAAVVANAPV